MANQRPNEIVDVALSAFGNCSYIRLVISKLHCEGHYVKLFAGGVYRHQ
jgi:hypothetical protein